ncbi:CPBP family intramembrane glutamic endopeptidase [Kosakonia oryzendophytica]|nr:CPBP family intramembrane glutamic endopeptidase [Kosakonia oryzendophytica]WBT60057.1 CPBP family intramembrane metalloprotease [Kosakonia oryzendophytica]
MCIAAFVIYYCLFYFAIFIPGYPALYRVGMADSFLHCALLLPCALLLWRYYHRQYKLLPLGSVTLRNVAVPLLGLLTLFFLETFFSQPEPWLESLHSYSGFVRWTWVVTACLAAPVSEEIIFRGFLLNAFLGWGKIPQQLGIVLVSALFAAIHMQYQTPVNFVYLFSFSAVMCVVRIGTGGLIVPVILHALANLGATFALYLS